MVLFASAALAQPADPTPPIDGLQAELATARPLYDPAMPILVRYSLRNVTDHTIEVPLDYSFAGDSGIGLPIEIALGDADNPLLSLKHEDGPPTPVIRPAESSAAVATKSPTVLRLAPHGAVGGEFDLRDVAKSIRYPGLYRIEWKPLSGRLPPAAVEFRVEPRKQAAIVTDYGVITCNLMYDAAPRNVENFLELVRDGFYKNRAFHRIIPGFIAQGGCPKGDGTGARPDGRMIPAELHNAPIDVGTLAMAHKKGAPDSASCQFFVALARLPDLDGKYTVIGQATDPESIRTLQAIAAVPTDKNGKPIHGVLVRSINLLEILPEKKAATAGK
ncbi:MAG: peptidylprolyl isomerase [Phycisphaerales bacterium]|nr:peptidylprolyl isomerase [Phycisphaerales bacterium]